MKEITVIEPVFFSDFQCIGKACRDHCCKGWEIYLDKPSVNRYLKSQKIEIRNIASEHIDKTRKSFTNWGQMKLNSAGECAFMDGENLCKVHKELGASALSPVCASYPRAKNTFRQEVNHTLSLSCPEATRLLLCNPQAMLFKESMQVQQTFNPGMVLEEEKKLINLMCATLIKASGLRLDEGLYAIANLFLFFNKAKQDDTFTVDNLEHCFMAILNSLESGTFTAELDALPRDSALQWALLFRLSTLMESRVGIRSSPVLQVYMKKVMYIQTEGLKAGDNHAAMQRLHHAWQHKALPWLAQRPHILSNYLQYRIYNDSFPGYQGRSPLACLYLLTAEWFLIKSLIAACFEFVDTVTEDDIINIIYSYHSVSKHNPAIMEKTFAEIDNVKVGDDISLIYLLN